jgi:AP2-like factor (euAP2 lineage)
MAEITLTNGKLAIVDNADFEHLAQYEWHYNGSAVRDGGKDESRFVLMAHDVIGKCADSRRCLVWLNGDKLDNRRQNLAYLNRSQIAARRKTKAKGCTSRYRGVCWDRALRKWRAYIKSQGSLTILGSFDTEQEAAAAYNEAAKDTFGEYARLNDLDGEA